MTFVSTIAALGMMPFWIYTLGPYVSEDDLVIISQQMSVSSHIRSVLIGVKYRNCHRTLNVYLLFAIVLRQIKSKLNYRLVTYKLASS